MCAGLRSPLCSGKFLLAVGRRPVLSLQTPRGGEGDERGQ